MSQHSMSKQQNRCGWSCEVFRSLIGLIGLDPSRSLNGHHVLQTGLNLIIVALESGAGYHIDKCDLLIPLIKDDLCYSLLQLMNASSIPTFMAVNRVFFLLFKSIRFHLKMQLECYCLKLNAFIANENPVKHDRDMKEKSLESLMNLCQLPGVVNELYLNYDCGVYCSNLFEDITQHLLWQFVPAPSKLSSAQIAAFHTLMSVVDAIEETSGNSQPSKLLLQHSSRVKISDDDQQNVLTMSQLNADGVAKWLRQNPYLDKCKIAEFLCSRKNADILKCYIFSIPLANTRLDKALRLLIETFRLPSESAEISKVLEYFSEHWFLSNNKPFEHVDAAFTLSYAIIMLNVDQHNPQVRKNQLPMTLEAFKRNLSGTHNGKDFDGTMLDEIFNSIKGEEILMPIEHNGLIRDKHLWCEMLRRAESDSEESKYISGLPLGWKNCEMFDIASNSIMVSLYYLLNNTTNEFLLTKALGGYYKCASIAACHGMSDVLDNLMEQLCKSNSLAVSSNEYSVYSFFWTRYVAPAITYPMGQEKIRVCAVQLVSQVFLRHLSALSNWRLFLA
uniref:SEC7 domain-containing protein n=1 Tax=Ditylenchus dipsaci TaxID=166011 RepID=A0A915E5M0_9BILA